MSMQKGESRRKTPSRERNESPSFRAINHRLAHYALAFAIVLVPAVLATRPAQAQAYTVLHSFCSEEYCSDGAKPLAGLVADSTGTLYGTAAGIWSEVYVCYGTVFKLHKSGNGYQVIDTPGCNLVAGLLLGVGNNLYGATYFGGAHSCGVWGNYGCGAVFAVNDKNDKGTLLYSFTDGKDGGFPAGGLVQDSAGDLYGTTYAGGASGYGVVFRLTKAHKETVLHSFAGADGANPVAGLVRDAAGNLYGTTYYGGEGLGVVFKVDKTGKETVLHKFSGTLHGAYPFAGLLRDAAGNLYGTTQWGGASNLGTVFKLDAGGKETVLYSFSGADGEAPRAGVIRDAAGNLYGTTEAGGAYGYGTVFKLEKTGKETLLYSFTGGTDGSRPWAALLRDANGDLYGTASEGGAYGYGVVFKLTP